MVVSHICLKYKQVVIQNSFRRGTKLKIKGLLLTPRRRKISKQSVQLIKKVFHRKVQIT